MIWFNFYRSIVSECLETNFSRISRAHVSKRKRCCNVKSSTYYFHAKRKVVADFQICISVPLRLNQTFPMGLRLKNVIIDV